MNPLFTAHIVLREIIARQRAKRVPFTPIQNFGLPLLVDARSASPFECPSNSTGDIR
jgi:hypothetical protein